MSEASFGPPRSGTWSLPDTSLGRSNDPEKPTGIQLLRPRPPLPNGRVHHDEIECRPIYAGRTVDGTDWWAVRTITDEQILPTDRIVCHYMPDNARLSGVNVQ